MNTGRPMVKEANEHREVNGPGDEQTSVRGTHFTIIKGQCVLISIFTYSIHNL